MPEAMPQTDAPDSPDTGSNRHRRTDATGVA
jgi:hypothetical protein